MKKNRIMRVFSVLLALTLISTCAISSTFAKYVTRAEGEDAARVAKWGVLVSVEGNAFGTEYKTHDDTYKGEFSVVASNEDQVVAPGTSSADLEQKLVATVKGTPEVAARYAITGTVTDVVLPDGTYTDYTHLVKADDGTYGYTDTFKLDKAYAPIKWNLVISKGNTSYDVAQMLYANLPANLLAAAENYGLTPTGCSFYDAVAILKKVADNDTYTQVVENALGQIVSGGSNFQLDVTDDGVFTMSYDFDPNKEMDFTFELTWAWAFEGNDKADTFLGNWAAVEQGQTIDGFVEPAAPASCEISANLVATATQID